MTFCAKMTMAAAGLAMSSVAVAQNTPEIEPNETKAQATSVLAPMAVGHTLTGNTTGTSTTVAGAASADTWRVRTALDALAIYRYRLVLTTSGTAGHSATIRGLGQVAAAQAPYAGVVGTANAVDTTIQTSVAATRLNQWYGFGKGEELFYRVTGAAATTADYVSTLERTTVTATNIGNFAPGSITISSLGQGHSSDTDFWVYDSNLDAIAGFGNDDEAATAVSGVPGATGATLQSVLKRTYAPGTYYIAMSTFQMANNLASPSDDDFRTGALMDFANVVVNSSATANVNTAFAVSDGVFPNVVVPNTHVGAFDVNWFSFTVLPAPSSVALLGMGGMLIARRRRA